MISKNRDLDKVITHCNHKRLVAESKAALFPDSPRCQEKYFEVANALREVIIAIQKIKVGEEVDY